ncbi:MAG: hypothetical protein KBA95_10955 [Acidobacteria bacterium]|nr:hypothetical protein [Acidobacteriota bacterium]
MLIVPVRVHEGAQFHEGSESVPFAYWNKVRELIEEMAAERLPGVMVRPIPLNDPGAPLAISGDLMGALARSRAHLATTRPLEGAEQIVRILEEIRHEVVSSSDWRNPDPAA